jgi:xanthine dehydrogenase YagR molybdenum-binding subunit
MKACDAIRDKIFHAAVTANDGPVAGHSLGELTLSRREIVATSGTTEPLEEAFKRLGVSTLEEYSEFVPEGLKPSAMADLYAGKLTMTGGPHARKVIYAMGAEFVEVRNSRPYARNPRASHRWSFCYRSAHEYPHRSQPADGRNDLGRQFGFARSH